MDLDSSSGHDAAAAADTVETAVTADSGATPAASPAADTNADANKPAPSVHEHVKASLEALKKPEPDSSTEGEGQQTPAVKEPAVADPKAAEEADKRLPFHSHPRWKQVTGENRTLKEQNAALGDKAQRWDVIDSKFRETGLAVDDVQPLFDGGAALKRAGTTTQEVNDLMRVGLALKNGDIQVVQKIAGPVLAALGISLTETMPEHIRKRVEEGALTEEDGRALAIAQRNAKLADTRALRAEAAFSQERNAQVSREMGVKMSNAAAAWEQRVQASDADWSLKAPLIDKAVRELLTQYQPTTEAHAIRICEMAYERINEAAKAFGAAKRKPAINPVAGGSTSTVAPAPKNLHEHVLRSVGLR
jgi:hypothetical protein